jgi:hypothetical protein
MTQQWVARPIGAWQTFTVLGVLLAAYSVYLIVLPSADPGHWRAFTTDPEMLRYLGDEFRSSGGITLGFSMFSIIMSVRWFKAGDPWAWALLWFHPLLYAWLSFTTWATGLWIFLVLVSSIALLLSMPRAKPRANGQTSQP